MNAKNAFTRTIKRDCLSKCGESMFSGLENSSKFHLSLKITTLILRQQLRFGPLTIAVGLSAC